VTVITPTKHGLRLSQHGVVISELRTSPGPTHSVFDVLAASIAALAPTGRVGVLGFAGGGMMAPLRALGVTAVIDSVDLDRAGYDLFQQHCPHWSAGVNWQQADAVAWLRQQPRAFDLLVDDLSVPQDEDVFKPAISWDVLSELIRARLSPGGFGVFNLLPAAGGTWKSDLARLLKHGGWAPAQVRMIYLDEFENRILIAGEKLPSAGKLGSQLRQALRRLRSRQADLVQVRKVD
jgi:spermidine synthase